jgi:predicted nucleic acid-binding protein
LIAYFDTSAIVPLLVEEPGSEAAANVWNEASRIAGTRLLFAEARAALAQARRTEGATAAQDAGGNRRA